MRTYDISPILSSSVVTADDFNKQNAQIGAAFNYGFDRDMIPAGALTSIKFNGRTWNSSAKLSVGVWNDAFVPTASTGANVDTALYTFDIRTSTLSGDWISLNDLGVSGAAFSFQTSVAGVLEGNFSVDFERRYGYNGALYTVAEGQNNWVDWGVFLDNALIASTYYCYPRRMTVCLPWTSLQPSGDHVVDLRFRIRSDAITSTNSYYAQTMSIYMLQPDVVLHKG